jgi:hypothetical protein
MISPNVSRSNLYSLSSMPFALSPTFASKEKPVGLSSSLVAGAGCRLGASMVRSTMFCGGGSAEPVSGCEGRAGAARAHTFSGSSSDERCAQRTGGAMGAMMECGCVVRRWWM